MRDPDANIAELTLIGVLQHGPGGEKLLGLRLDGGLPPFGGGKAAAPGRLDRRPFFGRRSIEMPGEQADGADLPFQRDRMEEFLWENLTVYCWPAILTIPC